MIYLFFSSVFDFSTILFIENKLKNGIVIYSWPKILRICTQIHRKLRSSLVTFCFSFDGLDRSFSQTMSEKQVVLEISQPKHLKVIWFL